MATMHSSALALREVSLIHHSRITAPPFVGVSRPHLVARVDQGTRGRLTVLSAPAGWGKSTLLAEWAARTPMTVAWVSLDPFDVTPERLLRLLVAALDRVIRFHFEDVATMLRTNAPAVMDQADDAFLASLDGLPDTTAIVLDDAHVLETAGTQRLLTRIIERAPVRLVLAVRGEPRLPLARLRAAGAVSMIRAEDLAFSVADARALLLDGPGAALDKHGLELLVERTEGWAAGLRLASASLWTSRDPRPALERLRGTHRDIADYFGEEVLSRLEPGLHDFLVETSILDTLSAPLADAVTGSANARERFADAAAADLFLVPLDDERIWYRYHALFRDVLRARFDMLPSARQGELHARAVSWFEGQGMVHEAMRHAVAAGDLNRTVDLIARHADTLMYQCGESRFLIDAIEELPDELLDTWPDLLRVYAWALTSAGRIDQAERLLERACDWLDESETGPGGLSVAKRQAQIAAVQARVAAYRGDHRATLTFGHRALDALDPVWHGQVIADVMLSMGFAERALGRLDEAAATFRDAARLGRQHRNAQAARWGVRYLALTRMSQGRLIEALAIVDEDLDRVAAGEGDGGSLHAALLVTKAEILVQRHQLAPAREALDRAFPLIQRDGDAKMLMNAYVAMGMLLHAEGEPERAREKMRRAEEVFPATAHRAWAAWSALAQGDLATAGRWAHSSGFSLDDEPDPSRGEFEQLTYARIMAAIEPEDGLVLVERLVHAAERAGRLGDAIELRLSEALARARLDDRAGACRSLREALVHASREGCVQVFLNEGTPMRALLRELARDRNALDEAGREFVLELIACFPTPDDAPNGVAALDEPLTVRQLEILQLLAQGQSNRQIADQLFIAEGTVKAHMHQIFGKLAARNRTEAVANARELDLIP
jgi:LuxR family maltose regulon positive regulatory protein